MWITLSNHAVIKKSLFFIFLPFTNLSFCWTHPVVEESNSSPIPTGLLLLRTDLILTLILPFKDKWRSNMDQGVSCSGVKGFSSSFLSVDCLSMLCQRMIPVYYCWTVPWCLPVCLFLSFERERKYLWQGDNTLLSMRIVHLCHCVQYCVQWRTAHPTGVFPTQGYADP